MKSPVARTLAFALVAGAWSAAAGCLSAAETTAPKAAPTEGFAIGTEAPEIEGVDLNGAPMKLSDFRGKVVVLDFWGDW